MKFRAFPKPSFFLRNELRNEMAHSLLNGAAERRIIPGDWLGRAGEAKWS
jgi:hypothetical protein